MEKYEIPKNFGLKLYALMTTVTIVILRKLKRKNMLLDFGNARTIAQLHGDRQATHAVVCCGLPTREHITI